MNDAMFPKVKRVADARDELYAAIDDLEKICDHRDKGGELRVLEQDYEYRESEDPLLTFCAFCGKELVLP